MMISVCTTPNPTVLANPFLANRPGSERLGTRLCSALPEDRHEVVPVGWDSEAPSSSYIVPGGMSAEQGRWFERRAAHLIERHLPEADTEIFSLFFNLLSASNAASSVIEARAFRPKGLTWGSFRTLFTLMVLGDLNPNEIAARSGVSDAAVSGVLKTLERQGHLDRTVDDSDRRRVRVSITESGRRLALAAYGDQNRVEREVVGLLTDEERAVLEAASRRLLLALRPDRAIDDP